MNSKKYYIDNNEIQVYTYTYESCNSIEVTVGTNALTGDSGHGGRTYFSLKDCASTDMRIFDSERNKYVQTDEITIVLGGETELDTFISSLEFAVKILKSQRFLIR